MQGYDAAAISDYNTVIPLEPSWAEAYFLRGASWEKMEDIDKAISNYNQAIKLNPQDAAFYFQRGGAFEEKGRQTDALADFSEYSRLKPKNTDGKDAFRELKIRLKLRKSNKLGLG